jgi:hypothetical protein
MTPLKRQHASKSSKARTSKALVLDVSGSECLSDARWNPKTKELAVTYARDGAQYIYEGVSRDDALAINDDPGDAMNYVIKPAYPYS